MREILRVVGVSFEDRQKGLRHAKQAGIQEVRLEREPDNPHDRRAVRVTVIPEGLFIIPWHVGYLAREDAARLYRVLDRVRVVRATILGEKTLGLELELEVPDGLKPRVQVWVALHYRLAKTKERWVIVGSRQGSSVFRVGQVVPEWVREIPEALAAIGDALKEEPVEVELPGQAWEKWMEKLRRAREDAADSLAGE